MHIHDPLYYFSAALVVHEKDFGVQYHSAALSYHHIYQWKTECGVMR